MNIVALTLPKGCLRRFDEHAIVAELVLELLLHLNHALAEAKELGAQVNRPHRKRISQRKHH